MATKKSVKKVKAEADYTASLIVFGRTFTATGSSVAIAIGALKPGIVKGRGVLTITSPSATHTRILSPLVIGRLFQTAGMSREIILTSVSKLFGV